MSQEGGLLSNFLAPLIKVGLLLIKNAFTPLAKNALLPLELMSAASATNAAIGKNIYGSGATTLIF